MRQKSLNSDYLSVFESKVVWLIYSRCPDGIPVSWIYSYHDDGFEDRRWKMDCRLGIYIQLKIKYYTKFLYAQVSNQVPKNQLGNVCFLFDITIKKYNQNKNSNLYAATAVILRKKM